MTRHRIKDADGKVIHPSDQPVCYASAMLWLRRENGGDAWVQRFFHELAASPKFKPDSQEGALNQSWHWLLCASLAARKDLSPVFAGEWKLPLAPETRAALSKIDWKRKGLTAHAAAAAIAPNWNGTDQASTPSPALVVP